MLKKIRIENNGDSDFLPGSMVDVLNYEDVKEQLAAEEKSRRRKTGMLGITKLPWQRIHSVSCILPGDNKSSDRGSNQR